MSVNRYKENVSLKSVKYLMILISVITVASTEDRIIMCSESNKICKIVSETGSIPYSEPGEVTAPTPECLYLSVYCMKDEDENTLNVTWTQKRTDIDKVEGYYIGISNFGENHHVRVHLDKAKIVKKANDSKHVTFQYQGFDIFRGSYNVITIHSLPMYQTSDTNHELRASIDDTEGFRKEVWLQKITLNCPYSIKGTENISVDEIESINQSDEKDNSITENSDEIPHEIYQPDDNFTPDADEPMVSVRVTIIACIFSMLGTVITIILIVLIYYTCSKAIECAHKSRQKKRKRAMKKTGTKKKPKILIITSLVDTDEKSHEVTQKRVLSLASALHECSEFDTHCNLWMTKEIAEKGAAIWSHSVLNTYNKIVMVCNSFTVAVLKQFKETDIWFNNIQSQSDPSVQIAYSFMTSATYSSSEIIIACVEKDDHNCLGDIELPWTSNCKKFFLPDQIKQFLNTLANDKCKNLALQSRIRTILDQRKNGYSEYKYSKGHDNGMKSSSSPTKSTLLDEKSKQKNIQKDILENDFEYHTEVLITKTHGEVQYDSMYSSRCNSHSTQSISSGDEDTGFHEKVIKKINSNPQISGARPKERN